MERIHGIERRETRVVVAVVSVRIFVVCIGRFLQEFGGFFSGTSPIRIDFSQISRRLRDMPVV